MDRSELADFLRRRRDRITPGDVGLPSGPRRRIPGLRREEVAQLAGMSADYYIRLEQARGPQPSLSMLAALARALRLSDDERDHLYRLAGHPPPERHGVTAHVRPGVLHLLDQLTDSPAMVVSDLGVTLAQNHLSRALVGDLRGRSFVYRWFADPSAREIAPPEDHAHHSRTHVADLRVTAARRGGDPDVVAMLRRLRAASPEFVALWDEHEVKVRRATTKRFRHPVVGLIELDCDTLVAEHDQRLVLHTARPGTDAHEKLRLLSVLGTQDLSPSGRSAASP